MDFENKMIERTGMCKFCNQITVIKVPEGWNEELINEEATKKCDCESAIAENEIIQIINSAELQIKDFFKDKKLDLFRDTLLKLVEPMARRQVERVSMKAGKYNISMKKKTASIEVGIKVVTEEKVES